MKEAPKRIWAWTWDLAGYGRQHGTNEWVPFRPKPISIKRWVQDGKWFWQGKEVDVEQVVTDYVRSDLVEDAVRERDQAWAALERCAVYFQDDPSDENWAVSEFPSMLAICKKGLGE